MPLSCGVLPSGIFGMPNLHRLWSSTELHPYSIILQHVLKRAADDHLAYDAVLGAAVPIFEVEKWGEEFQCVLPDSPVPSPLATVNGVPSIFMTTSLPVLAELLGVVQISLLACSYASRRVINFLPASPAPSELHDGRLRGECHLGATSSFYILELSYLPPSPGCSSGGYACSHCGLWISATSLCHDGRIYCPCHYHSLPRS